MDEEGQPWRLAFWPSGCSFGVFHPSDKNKGVARVGHPGSFVIQVSHPGDKNKSVARVEHPGSWFGSLNANARRFGAGTVQLTKVKIAGTGGDGCDGGHRAV